MTKETCKTILKILTNKECVKILPRGNVAIECALNIAKSLGKHNCLIQDEGGWLKYPKLIQKVGMEEIKLITNNGLIYPKELKNHPHDSVLLLNSMAGYIVPHDMKEVLSACVQNDVFLINDVSGSIGTYEGKIGDIIVGSFGKAKPVNLGTGGFIAFDDSSWEIKEEEPSLDYELLETKLRSLKTRLKKLREVRDKVKSDLEYMDVVHKDSQGINVVVRFSDEEEKQKLINYCEENNYEYTVCPREIRILEDAISIEIKRL